MAQLKIFQKIDRQNQELQTLELDPNREYILGRAADCDVVLPGERGISRQHLRLTYIQGDIPFWQATVLSQYGELYSQGKKVSEIQLTHTQDFSIPPLYFQFVKSSVVELEPVLVETPAFIDDLTHVGPVEVVPYLRLLNNRGETIQTVKLEGQSWMVGRDPANAVCLGQEGIGALQFELVRQEQQFFVREMNETSPMLLNGQKLLTQDLRPIRSGDKLTIGSWTVAFELHDAGYERRLLEANPHLSSSVTTGHSASKNVVTPYDPRVRPSYSPPPGDMGYETYRPQPAKTNWVRLVTVGLVLFAGAIYLLDESGGGKRQVQRQPAQAKPGATAFERLKPEQQQFVRQSHRLAKELLMQGRYEMARQEILKIHQFVPTYEDSVEIENTAMQGVQLQQERSRIEAKEKERMEVEEKIQRQIQVCRAKIDAAVTAQIMDECLSSVIQFNPEHPGFQALKTQVDEIETERHIREAQKSDYKRRSQKQKALFQQAQMLQRQGQTAGAIKAFENVIGSNLPDPDNLKARSKREIASIQQSMSDRQAKLESQADASYKKGDLKAAITALKKAVEINPENEVTKGKVTSMLAELKKQMQTTYQEAILEESVGEVETAKAKWKKIREQSLPDEEYYKKATSKLKKYGGL